MLLSYPHAFVITSCKGDLQPFKREVVIEVLNINISIIFLLVGSYTLRSDHHYLGKAQLLMSMTMTKFFFFVLVPGAI